MSAREKVNILLVDDLPDKLLALQTVLEDLGQNLVIARSGKEALRKLLNQDFAVILLDVNMPDVDGFETAALIRQRRRCAQTPIIFVTAFSDDMHTARAYSLGAVDFILSPVVPEILRTKVSVFVELFQRAELEKRHADERIVLEREQAARAVAEAANRRAMFLAEASRILAANSLSFESILPELCRLAVPYLADLSMVTCGDELVGKWPTQMAWTDPVEGMTSRALQNPDLQPDMTYALRKALQSGQPLILPLTSSGMALAQGLPDPFPIELTSALVIPLKARNRTLGTVLLARGPVRPPYGAEEMALAEDLAGRAAIAVDNARLYQDIQEADQRKNEFLGMLAHELRNPLAPIRNAVQILRLNEYSDPDQIWSMDLIDRQLQHLVRLVDDLLEVSRITQGKIKLQSQIVDAATVVGRAVETSRPLIDARRHELVVTLAAEPLWIEADATRLAQVLTNLLNNAAKYSEKEGRIHLHLDKEDTEVVFRVRDSGVGIPADMLAKVFDLFFQADRSLDRSQGGLGIGLTLVHRLVELHGGKVQVFSAGVHQGSEFVVRLPMSAPPPDGPAQTSIRATHQAVARRILVVDDNYEAAVSLAKVLRSAGHEVAIAQDGFAALETAPRFKPEIVMLDIGLPRMDGYEVARRMYGQAWFRQVALVAVTGYGQDEDFQRSQEAGFHHHLVKPVDPQGLRALIASLRPEDMAQAPLVGTAPKENASKAL